MLSTDVFPNPVFEGSEKRLEVDFSPSSKTSSPHGLRALSRDQLDELMSLAHCCIVSSRSNASFDAYVLSESSLFVYPTKWILKTCGTTRLLDSLPKLLEFASSVGLEAAQCKFTRATFLFPEQQPFPHSGFEDEVRFLDAHLSQRPLINALGQACILGDAAEGLQWHKYVCGSKPSGTYNLEICMTDLGEEAARQFFRTEAFVSAAETTKDSGILALKPNAIIDDYVFEPCGYSMNGIDGTGLITIHITPEPGFSYASVEVSGSAEDVGCPNHLLAAAIKIFQPGKVSMALSVDTGDDSFGALASLPAPYRCPCAVAQKMEDVGGGVTYFYNMVRDEKLTCPASPISILHHAASFLSVSTANSDNCDSSSNEDNGEASETELDNSPMQTV